MFDPESRPDFSQLVEKFDKILKLPPKYFRIEV